MHYTKRKGSSKISLYCDSEDQIKVTMPYWVTYEEADRIISSDTGWVSRYIDRVKKAAVIHGSLYIRNKGRSIKELSEDLLEKAKATAGKYGFDNVRFFVRRQRSRWGSCSADKKIYLNVKLMFLSEELTEYVIIHELVHTKVLDHSKVFWAELEKILPGAKALDRRLRKYQLRFL